MSTPPQPDVTTLLARLQAGDGSAGGQLLAVVYDELRALAGHMFRDQPADHTLQPTALVNEACLRLLRSAGDWNDRKHFLRVAAKAMRQLLTDHARARLAQRRGAGAAKESLDSSVTAPTGPEPLDLVELDEALTKLSQLDERLSQVFELRFLVGLSVKETGELLEVSSRTVELDTQLVRGWLQRELAHGRGLLERPQGNGDDSR